MNLEPHEAPATVEDDVLAADYLPRICQLLESPDPELRHAAARVLGAIRPGGGAAAQALAKALGSGDAKLRALALQAIGAVGGAGVFEPVAALMEEPGDLGAQAMEVVASLGRAVLPRLRRLLDKTGEVGRRRILGIAARLRGAE
ncbi:MAG: HEAT repeat domain-containing protein, partial [Planctomycetota bacterium]